MSHDIYPKPLLHKLRQVFKDGYRPSRGAESYCVTLNNGVELYSKVNCLGHSVFNLRNQQFFDYQIMPPCRLYSSFDGIGFDTNKKASKRMFDFIKATGLEIEECNPDETITDFKSWKIALYFEPNEIRRDYHYLLEEAPQLWSGKIGKSPYQDRLHVIIPPEILTHDNTPTYELYGTYKITNPHASESNPYVKGHYTQERSI